jgi:hypothetical protein
MKSSSDSPKMAAADVALSKSRTSRKKTDQYGGPEFRHLAFCRSIGSLVDRSAYKQAIAHQGRGYPILFSHDASQPLGTGRISDSKTHCWLTASW